MSEVKIKNSLDVLNKDEIINFYELFFGSILIKKPNFPYYANLSRSLEKDTVVKSVVDRLNDIEQKILKILSKEIFVPNDYIIDKLNIVLNIPNLLISKSINYLIEKKYIFLRDDRTLVAIDIFFPQIKEKIPLVKEDAEVENYSSSAIYEINNLINYFISAEIKFSNNYNLYKKDLMVLKEIFSHHSKLNEKDFNYIAYFFSKAFLQNEEVIIDNVKYFFSLSVLDRAYFIVKELFPWLYPFLLHTRKLKKQAKIKLEDFKSFWESSLLKNEFNFIPLKTEFNESLKFLEKLNLIKKDKEDILVNCYSEEDIKPKDEVKLSSSFNFYINADSHRSDFYMASFFSNLKKYNKIVEYEITEQAINRSIKNGITLDVIFNFFNDLNLKISTNVETVIKQWFDKYDSFFFCTGTLFFCSTPEKAKILNTMIKRELIKASEVKKDEVFFIKEEDKLNFFDVLAKANISFYSKKPKEFLKQKEEKLLDVSYYFN